MVFAAIAAVVAISFAYSATNCSGESCSDGPAQKAGITVVVGVVGFFLIRAIETSGQSSARRRDEPPAVPADLSAIEKLGELRDRGILTEEEFQRKKAELLDSS